MVNEKTSKVTVLLPESEFTRLDCYCEANGFKKSTLIARLIRDYLNREYAPEQTRLPLPLPEAFER